MSPGGGQLSKGHGMLLLSGLPERTQITLDGHSEAYLTNAQFAGIKSLPAGWHCISWSIASSDAAAQDLETSQTRSDLGPTKGSIRNVVLRWFDEDEVAVRQLDRVQQRLVSSEHASPSTDEGSSIGRSKLRRFTRKVDPSGGQAESTVVVTPDVLNSVEPRLLPYPATAEAAWRDATRHLTLDSGWVGKQVVAKVMGVERGSGDSVTDTLATGPGRAKDAREQATLQQQQQAGSSGRIENGKIIWGKSRPPSELDQQMHPYEVEVDGEASSGLDTAEQLKRKRSTRTETTEGEDEAEAVEENIETLQFTSFDLRRSWPPNCVGADITRWSQDKSWLLQDVARRSTLGITARGSDDDDDEWFRPVLCEFELSFLLFVMASNFYAWEQWKDLLALFCRSSSLIGASDAFQLHPSETMSSPSQSDSSAPFSATWTEFRLDAHIALLSTLHSQFVLLDPEFWSNQTSRSEEHDVLKHFDRLRSNIARSLAAIAGRHTARSVSASNIQRDQERLISAWRKLSHLTASKFGWQLNRRLDEEAEVEDDLGADEGEDAPVIVEL